MSQAKSWQPLGQYCQVPSKYQALAQVLIIFKQNQIYTINMYDKQIFEMRSTHNTANACILFTTQLLLWCGVPVK